MVMSSVGPSYSSFTREISEPAGHKSHFRGCSCSPEDGSYWWHFFLCISQQLHVRLSWNEISDLRPALQSMNPWDFNISVIFPLAPPSGHTLHVSLHCCSDSWYEFTKIFCCLTKSKCKFFPRSLWRRHMWLCLPWRIAVWILWTRGPQTTPLRSQLRWTGLVNWLTDWWTWCGCLPLRRTSTLQLQLLQVTVMERRRKCSRSVTAEKVRSQQESHRWGFPSQVRVSITNRSWGCNLFLSHSGSTCLLIDNSCNICFYWINSQHRATWNQGDDIITGL